MASLSESLHTFLTATVPLSGRWWPLRVPDGELTRTNGTSRVAGTYQRISTVRPATHSGGTDWAMRRVQLSLWSEDYDAGLAAALAVVAALNGTRQTMAGYDVSATIADEAEDVDPTERGLYRQRIDVMLGSDAP